MFELNFIAGLFDFLERRLRRIVAKRSDDIVKAKQDFDAAYWAHIEAQKLRNNAKLKAAHMANRLKSITTPEEY